MPFYRPDLLQSLGSGQIDRRLWRSWPLIYAQQASSPPSSLGGTVGHLSEAYLVTKGGMEPIEGLICQLLEPPPRLACRDQQPDLYVGVLGAAAPSDLATGLGSWPFSRRPGLAFQQPFSRFLQSGMATRHPALFTL